MASHVAARYGSVGSLKSLAKFGFDIFELDINKVQVENFNIKKLRYHISLTFCLSREVSFM